MLGSLAGAAAVAAAGAEQVADPLASLGTVLSRVASGISGAVREGELGWAAPHHGAAWDCLSYTESAPAHPGQQIGKFFECPHSKAKCDAAQVVRAEEPQWRLAYNFIHANATDLHWSWNFKELLRTTKELSLIHI